MSCSQKSFFKSPPQFQLLIFSILAKATDDRCAETTLRRKKYPGSFALHIMLYSTTKNSNELLLLVHIHTNTCTHACICIVPHKRNRHSRHCCQANCVKNVDAKNSVFNELQSLSCLRNGESSWMNEYLCMKKVN